MLKSLRKSTTENTRIKKDIEAIISLSATLCNTSFSNMHLLNNTNYYTESIFDMQSVNQKGDLEICNYLYTNNISSIIIPDTKKDNRFNQLESVKNNSIR